MARTAEMVIPWFPHVSNAASSDKKTISILQSKYKNDGYGTWFKLCELACANPDGKELDLNSREAILSVASYCLVSDEVLEDILNICSDIGAIDSHLWKVHKVYWCDNLVENTISAFSRRKAIPQKPVFCSDCSSELRMENLPKNEKAFEDSSEQVRLSRLLFQYVQKFVPRAKFSSQKWAEKMDHLLRLDNYPAEEIEKVIHWVFTQTQWEQWKYNIQSVEKLRKHYPRLQSQMLSDNKKPYQRPSRNFEGIE